MKLPFTFFYGFYDLPSSLRHSWKVCCLETYGWIWCSLDMWHVPWRTDSYALPLNLHVHADVSCNKGHPKPMSMKCTRSVKPLNSESASGAGLQQTLQEAHMHQEKQRSNGVPSFYCVAFRNETKTRENHFVLKVARLVTNPQMPECINKLYA